MSISADGLIVATLAFTTVLGISRSLWLYKEWHKWLGPATWEFSTSWASTFTLVGALLGTILLQSGAVPATTVHLPLVGYAGLNLLFGVITVLAPVFYSVFQQATPSREDVKSEDVKEPLYRGVVWAFLLASSLTLWAVLGELATMFFLLDEIWRTDGVSTFGFWVLIVLLIGCLVLLCVYWVKSTGWVVQYQALPPARKTGDAGLDATEDRAVSIRLRPWPLL